MTESFLQRDARNLLDGLEGSLTPEGVERLRMILRGERVRNAKDFLAAARLALEFTAAKPAQAFNVQQAVVTVLDPYSLPGAVEAELLPSGPPRPRSLPERRAQVWREQRDAEQEIREHDPLPRSTAAPPGSPPQELDADAESVRVLRAALGDGQGLAEPATLAEVQDDLDRA